MLLILLSWIYSVATTLVVGTSTSRLFRLQATHPIITVMFGCFSITLLIGFWAIFAPINELFYSFIFVLSLVLFYINKTEILIKLNQFKNLFSSLKPPFKIALALITVLILAKCASAPFIVDNETYYIQTIKWLNHYGFTKGLINLHPFLGQTSGWHILQSGFNFDFIYTNLNDLSGFALLLGNSYAIEKLNNYCNKITKNKMDLVVGLFPLFNLFLFQFIGAPSLDIAIYVIGIIVFYEFISCYKQYNKHSFYAVFILSIFATFIKLTGLVFFIFGLILYFYFYIYTRKNTKGLLIIALITFVLFVTKNTIITGEPLYPLQLSFLQQEWSLPLSIQNYLSHYETAASYGLTIEAFEPKRLLHWLTQGKLDTIFNVLLLLCILFIPFLFKTFKINKPIKTIYFTGIVFVIFLLFYSPQYRFYFPFLMFFILLFTSMVIKTKRLIIPLLFISILLSFIPLFVTINTSVLSNNTNHKNTGLFSLDYVLEPHVNFKYNSTFNRVIEGNTTIHSLSNKSGLIWKTGNAPLPALSKEQLDYFKTYFNVIPQQYSNNLKDGFYSKSIKE